MSPAPGVFLAPANSGECKPGPRSTRTAPTVRSEVVERVSSAHVVIPLHFVSSVGFDPCAMGVFFSNLMRDAHSECCCLRCGYFSAAPLGRCVVLARGSGLRLAGSVEAAYAVEVWRDVCCDVT